MSLFDQAQLNRAISELKATTRVTMETVGVRFGRRVNTSVYRENLACASGESMLRKGCTLAWARSSGGLPLEGSAQHR